MLTDLIELHRASGVCGSSCESWPRGAKSGVIDQLSNLIGACTISNGFKKSNAVREALVDSCLKVMGDSTHAKKAERTLNQLIMCPDGRWHPLDNSGGKERTGEAVC